MSQLLRSKSTLLLLVAVMTAFVCPLGAAFVACPKHAGKRMSAARYAMKELPKDVVKYSTVPKTGAFTAAQNNIPKGLLKNHSTKDGTWGVIRVLQGRLQYKINGKDESEEAEQFELDTDKQGIIEPEVFHEVAPLTDDVEFVVEFHRLPNTGPVDEKREGL